MKTYTNAFGNLVAFKPFYHTACKVWRVARFENNELESVYESKSFETESECIDECNKVYNHWNKN